MSQSPPNLDIANDDDMPGIMADVLSNWLRGVDDMIPAKVVSYDDSANRATIKPLVMLGTTDGQKISRASLANIPVFRFGGGGFFVRFPVKPGDFGWLKATDRDLSLIMQRGGLEDWPNTLRQHSFSDGMFFPDTLKSWVIDGGNADALVIQSLDGSVCVSLHDDKASIKAPLIEFDGPVKMLQTLQVDGDANFDAALKNQDVNCGVGHDHGNVENGPGRTDPLS